MRTEALAAFQIRNGTIKTTNRREPKGKHMSEEQIVPKVKDAWKNKESGNRLMITKIDENRCFCMDGSMSVCSLSVEQIKENYEFIGEVDLSILKNESEEA